MNRWQPFPQTAQTPRAPIACERFAFPGNPVTQGTPHRPVDLRVLPRLVTNKAGASLGHLTKEAVSREIVVGWDWADGHHDVVVQDRLGHARAAWDALQVRLMDGAQRIRSDVHMVIETSQGLVVHSLSTTGFWVYPVNPKVFDGRRKPSNAKTGRLDAAILARLGRQERDQLRPAGEDWVELRQLTRIDEDVTRQTARLANQPTAALKSDYPQALVAPLQALQAEQRALREPLKALFLANPDADLWMSVPSVRVTLGTRLLAGFGPDRDRFELAEAAQTLSGTRPVLCQSGKLKRVHRRPGCDKHFRAAVDQLAFTSLSRCAWARQYYNPYRARGHGYQAALHALANVWMRILFRMWKTGQPYVEARLLAARTAPLLACISGVYHRRAIVQR